MNPKAPFPSSRCARLPKQCITVAAVVSHVRLHVHVTVNQQPAICIVFLTYFVCVPSGRAGINTCNPTPLPMSVIVAAAENEGSLRRLKRALMRSCCSLHCLKPATAMEDSTKNKTFDILNFFSCCSLDGSANDRRELGSQSTRCGASRDGTLMPPPTGPAEGLCGGRVSVGGDLEPCVHGRLLPTCRVGVVSSAVAKAGSTR